MRKNGYTLAEVLIAVAIVGVVSALMLPLINKAKPDANKVMYLKTYDSLVTLIRGTSNNETIYPSEVRDSQGNVIEDYSNYPFLNLSKATLSTGEEISAGKGKLCRVLALGFNATSNSCNVDDNGYISNYTESKFKPNFVTQNGIEFMITTNKDDTKYQSDIYFDIDGSEKGNNCLYNAETCPKPDRFKLLVASNGKVVASDPKSQFYLDTRANWLISEGEKDYEPIEILPEDILDSFPDEPPIPPTPKPPAPPTPEEEESEPEEVVSDCTSSGVCSCGERYDGKIINCIFHELSDTTPGKVTFYADLPVVSNVGLIDGQKVMPKGKSQNSVMLSTTSGSWLPVDVGNLTSAEKSYFGDTTPPESVRLGVSTTIDDTIVEDDTYIYAICPYLPLDFNFPYSPDAGVGGSPVFSAAWAKNQNGKYVGSSWYWHGTASPGKYSGVHGKKSGGAGYVYMEDYTPWD